MRFTHLFLLLLAGTILGWAGCDDDEIVIPPTECFEELPSLSLSQGCEPKIYEFTDLNDFPDDAGLALPPQCAATNDRGQIVKIDIPASGVLDVHVYNGTYGYANVTVFTANNCDEDIAAVNSCYSTTAVASSFTVDGLNGFDNVYIRIDISESSPSEPFEEYVAEDGQFIGIAAWETPPDLAGVVGYAGISPTNQLEQLGISCDRGTSQRIIIGSCNPNADLGSWLDEASLPESESYAGPGGVVTAADVPPGLDPNTTGTALSKRRPRQNTDDYFAEQDFILRVPAPNGPGLLDANDFDPSFKDVVDCLKFELGTGSTEKESDQFVVTMIDGGVDNTGERIGIFNNHLNRSIDQPFAFINSLGYDFYNATDAPIDEFGHGTATAGALVGSYKGSAPLTVIHNKIFSVDPVEGVLGSYFGAVVATQVAGNIGSDIINMSFGSSPDEEPQALRCAIEYAISQGATIVTSAGNETTDIDMDPQWPAAFSQEFFPAVITVTSYNYPANGFPDAAPILSDFSNFGKDNTTVAAYLTAKTPRWQGGFDDFTYLAGTSISAPVISAALATDLVDGSNLTVGFLSNLPQASPLSAGVQNGQYLRVCE